MELAKNPVCSEYTGTLPYKSLYLPCVKTLRGSYVLVHLLSSTPLELSVCGFQVLSDVAVPVAERIRPTKSPTANHNESSADDGSFESYPFSKKVAVRDNEFSLGAFPRNGAQTPAEAPDDVFHVVGSADSAVRRG
ncbi:hypothetical protein MRX96_016342 [Rhipicephalus microplus]